MTLNESFESQGIIWFSCKSNLYDNYLKCGHFQKVMGLDFQITESSVIKLFDKLHPSDIIWTRSCTHELFMEIKKTFSLVKNAALDNINFTTHALSVEKLRMDILRVLQFFLENFQSLNAPNFILMTCNTPEDKSYLRSNLMQFMTEMKKLLLFIGRISNIYGITNIKDFNDTSTSAVNFYHYFHLCLDIWYSCIAIAYTIQCVIPSNFNLNEVFCIDFIDHSSPILQLASLAVYDLMYIAVNNYKNINMFSNSPFTCSCISDFWIMLIHLLDKRNAFLEGFSFWSVYQTCLQIVVKAMSSESLNEDCPIETFSVINNHVKGSLEACFWLTSRVALLYKYDMLGNFSECKKVKSGYASGKYLVSNLLSSSTGTHEKSLRNCLLYCIQLVKIWETKADMLLPLTDFYIKKIDEMFNVQEMELKGLSYLYKDSLSWFMYINNLPNSTLHGKESSFDRFLCILNMQLKQDVDHSLWRSLKGRIYSKFIPKKIKEMSEIGLQNSFSLFLTIAAAGQLEIIGKICEVVSAVERVAFLRKQIISWKALFVLLYIFQNGNHNMDKITALVSKFFNCACSDYAKMSNGNTHKTHLMNLLLVYIDNMNGLFKTSDSLNLSEYQLLEVEFSNLFSTCSISEINYVLGVLLDIFKRIDNVTESSRTDLISNEAQYIRILQAVFNNIYPFLQNIATTDTPPPLVSDIAGILTKLTYKFSSSLISCVPVDFHTIFIYFGCKENVNSSVICQYLCFILDCANLINELKLKVTDFSLVIVQSWLKCSISIQSKCKSMQELTRKIMQLNEVMEDLPNIKTLDLDSEDHVCLSIKFYKLVGDAFNNVNDAQRKIKIAHKMQHYFKNYTCCVLNEIKKGKCELILSHVYKLISHLVEHCSVLLHFHVSSDYILLQLLDQTIYPQILFPGDKALQSLVSCSIKKYLPHLIKGLFKLEYRKDKSIEREIRDIFIYYIGVYPVPSNPLTKLVIDSVARKPETLTMDAYNFILDVLKSSLLSGNVENPMCIFEFYQEVFRLSPPECKNKISNILLKCAMEIYMKQNDSLAEFWKILMKKILIHLKERMSLNDTKVILHPVIQWFVQEKLQWSVMHGFNVLDLFVEYLPQIMSDIVPFLTKSVETLEMKRGVGEDMLLRNGLRNIVIKLQHKLSQK